MPTAFDRLMKAKSSEMTNLHATRLAVWLASALAAMQAVAGVERTRLADLSLEELGNVQVVSVSKRAEPLIATAASVFVITRDDILRSGVTSIAEALRLAPGVEVARRSAHAWSISIRGFNRDLSNKLLVLIDGRSVYSPLYAGVFWDVQDTLLQDVDRIEVISGPGGTVWGANAVNGVINIITRSAGETKGSYVAVGGGIEEEAFAAFRYGGELGPGFDWRGYLKYFDRDSSRQLDGQEAADDWRMVRAGFRADRDRSVAGKFRLQGDLYSGEKSGVFLEDFELGTLPGGVFADEVEVSGGNLLVQWSRALDGDGELELEAYLDHTRRDIPNTYDETRDALNIDVQQHASVGERHRITWGAGFRLTTDQLDNSAFAAFLPDSRTDRTYSLFLQDRIGLWDNGLLLTLGSKFEINDYTDFEWQPNVRLAWRPGERQTTWVAVSRAVRIPSRLDAHLRLTAPLAVPSLPFPVYVVINGSEDFDSEELTAYEAGYRFGASDAFSLDLSLYYNEYESLQTTEPGAPELVLPSHILLPNTLANNLRGRSHGGTLAVDWRPAESWRLSFHYAWLDLQLRTGDESQDPAATALAGNSPRHQASLFSFVDVLEDFSLYTGLRYVGELPNLDVDAYTALDLSIRWHASDTFVASLTAQNLTDGSHLEFGAGANQAERALFLKLAWGL
jgi:iron complex outermembrane receptor protein